MPIIQTLTLRIDPESIAAIYTPVFEAGNAHGAATIYLTSGQTILIPSGEIVKISAEWEQYVEMLDSEEDPDQVVIIEEEEEETRQ